MTKIYKILTIAKNKGNSTIFTDLNAARKYAYLAAKEWNSIWIFESIGETEGQVLWEKLEIIR